MKTLLEMRLHICKVAVSKTYQTYITKMNESNHKHYKVSFNRKLVSWFLASKFNRFTSELIRIYVTTISNVKVEDSQNNY